MTTKEIAKKYGVNQAGFEQYLVSIGAGSKGMLGGYSLDDNIEVHVQNYKNNIAEQEAQEAALKQEQQMAEQQKQAALSQMLITSGFTFDGYKITKYSGYISGDDCVTMPRNNFWGSNKVADNLCGCLVKIRRQAIQELKEAAYALGCNAVIGVDFDYLTMDPQHAAALNATQTVYEPYVICVTANGNAVVIEKE